MSASFSTLVSGDDLALHIAAPDWRVFDCRHDLADTELGRKAYARGHLPGAHFLHLDDDLSGPRTGRNGRHPLPDPAQLVSILSACGVGNQTQVVAYDDSGGMFAARLWWMMRWLGHHRVAVLDGGFQAWLASAKRLENGTPKHPPAVYPLALQSGKVDADYVLQHLDSPEMLLVDARSPDRFRGENETLDPIGGHIPGALNRFFRDNLGADGCFKPGPQLRREFEALLGGRDPACVIHQCGSGVTACHNLLAMELAGLHGSRLYAGSWSEWCSDGARPIARGAQ